MVSYGDTKERKRVLIKCDLTDRMGGALLVNCFVYQSLLSIL